MLSPDEISAQTFKTNLAEPASQDSITLTATAPQGSTQFLPVGLTEKSKAYVATSFDDYLGVNPTASKNSHEVTRNEKKINTRNKLPVKSLIFAGVLSFLVIGFALRNQLFAVVIWSTSYALLAFLVMIFALTAVAHLSEVVKVIQAQNRRGRPSINRGNSLFPLVAITAIISSILIPVYIGTNLYWGATQRAAETYLEQAHYEKAVETYGTLIELVALTPDKSPNVGRANCYVKMGEYKKAIDDYTIAINEDPAIELYQLRAAAYGKFGKANLRAQDEKIATSMIKKLSLQENAERLFDDKHFADALKQFDALVQKTPKSAKAHFLRARCLNALGHHEAAIIAFSQAITFYPGFGQAYYERGKVKEQMQQLDQAQKDFAVAKSLGYEP